VNRPRREHLLGAWHEVYAPQPPLPLRLKITPAIHSAQGPPGFVVESRGDVVRQMRHH